MNITNINDLNSSNNINSASSSPLVQSLGDGIEALTMDTNDPDGSVRELNNLLSRLFGTANEIQHMTPVIFAVVAYDENGTYLGDMPASPMDDEEQAWGFFPAAAEHFRQLAEESDGGSVEASTGKYVRVTNPAGMVRYFDVVRLTRITDIQQVDGRNPLTVITRSPTGDVNIFPQFFGTYQELLDVVVGHTSIIRAMSEGSTEDVPSMTIAGLTNRLVQEGYTPTATEKNLEYRLFTDGNLAMFLGLYTVENLSAAWRHDFAVAAQAPYISDSDVIPLELEHDRMTNEGGPVHHILDDRDN